MHTGGIEHAAHADNARLHRIRQIILQVGDLQTVGEYGEGICQPLKDPCIGNCVVGQRH